MPFTTITFIRHHRIKNSFSCAHNICTWQLIYIMVNADCVKYGWWNYFEPPRIISTANFNSWFSPATQNTPNLSRCFPWATNAPLNRVSTDKMGERRMHFCTNIFRRPSMDTLFSACRLLCKCYCMHWCRPRQWTAAVLPEWQLPRVSLAASHHDLDSILFRSILLSSCAIGSGPFYN